MNPMWVWIRWYLGEGEFKPFGPRNPSVRPDVPRHIPGAWWERMARLLAERRKLQNRPPQVHDDVLAFWRRMGVWITRIDHFPAEYLRAYCQDDYRIVILPCLYGTELEPNLDHLDTYVEEAHRLGFKVAGSQWGRAADAKAAHVEAQAAAEAVERFGFDAWVMNGEKPYEGGRKSAAYVEEFRFHYPSLPFGWSPEPRLDLDHEVLQRHGVCYMPQAYPLENNCDIPFCVRWADEFGYQRKNVVPLVGAYPVNDRRYDAGWYARDARSHGLKGLILYAGNQAADVPEFWRELVV